MEKRIDKQESSYMVSIQLANLSSVSPDHFDNMIGDSVEEN
jgi:hypothetical protein